MRLGCVVLRVASRKKKTAGHDMWFYPILKGYDPMKSTLIDSEENLLECHDHILINENLIKSIIKFYK